MKPTALPHVAALVIMALGLWVAQPASAAVYRCTEGGQTVYSDHPCGSRSVTVPLVDNTPTAADQKAARERASVEAAEVREAQAARRKNQAEEDARQAHLAAQTAEQARIQQQRNTALIEGGTRYCHRVYIGPMPYPYLPPAPIMNAPMRIPTPMPRIVQPKQANGGKPLPFTQAPVSPPTHFVPRPPHPHAPFFRIVCDPGYFYDGPDDLLPIE